jgi:hypothetical protein
MKINLVTVPRSQLKNDLMREKRLVATEGFAGLDDEPIQGKSK